MGEANWLGSSAGETWCFMSGGAAPATTSRNDLETRRKKIPSRKQWTQKKSRKRKTDERTQGRFSHLIDFGRLLRHFSDIQEKLRCWRARIGTKVSDHLLSSKTKWWKSHWHHKRDGKVLSKSGTNERARGEEKASQPPYTLTQRVTVNVRRRRVCALYTPVIAEFGTLYTTVLYLTYNIH
jgi:hypothetical protein